MKNFDKIEKYLNGEMEAEEKVLFEVLIKEDKALATEVELQRAESVALEGLAFDLLKEDIAGMDQKKEEESEDKIVPLKRRRNYISILAIAASIAFLLMAGYYLLKDKKDAPPEIVEQPKITPETDPDNKKELPEELKEDKEQIVQTPKEDKPKPPKEIIPDYRGIAMATRPADFVTNVRGKYTADAENPEWENIVENFEQKQYDQSIQLVDALSKEHDFYFDGQQLKAESLLLSAKYKEASKIYKSLIQDGDEFQKDVYEIDLLTSLVAQLPATKKQVDDLFNTIITNTDHTYGDDAKRIQDALKKAGY